MASAIMWTTNLSVLSVYTNTGNVILNVSVITYNNKLTEKYDKKS
jgi:hypothetical protein